MDEKRFLQACEKIIGGQRMRKGIGTLGEKTLHAVLKEYFEDFDDNKEIKIGNYVADIAGENGIIEIQTRNFAALRNKLTAFLEYCDVTVAYPIPAEKYVRWLDEETGELSQRRKSPKKMNCYDCFLELYKIKSLLNEPRLHICLCLIEAEDIRFLNGYSKDKKRGSSRCDRIPLRLIDEIWLNSTDDYRYFIPHGLGESFTSADFAKCAKINKKMAGLALNILTYTGTVTRISKKGREYIYCITE